jgi:uncharacterized protein YcgL (UPF0745 family)
MQQFGGKDSKRHFTVVIGGKEHGLYVSSTPSSAAKKAVTKLCAANKGKKVEFHIREITQGSKKKTYGPYLGHIEKLKEPIELKGRVIKYKPVAKLSGKDSKKMRGGLEKKCFHYRMSKNDDDDDTILRKNPSDHFRSGIPIDDKNIIIQYKENNNTFKKYIDTSDRFVKKDDNLVIMYKYQPVEVIDLKMNNEKNLEEFALVKIDDVQGYVNTKYLKISSDPLNKDKPCFRSNRLAI